MIYFRNTTPAKDLSISISFKCWSQLQDDAGVATRSQSSGRFRGDLHQFEASNSLDMVDINHMLYINIHYGI
jgi:hypothetical protein